MICHRGWHDIFELKGKYREEIIKWEIEFPF